MAAADLPFCLQSSNHTTLFCPIAFRAFRPIFRTVTALKDPSAIPCQDNGLGGYLTKSSQIVYALVGRYHILSYVPKSYPSHPHISNLLGSDFDSLAVHVRYHVACPRHAHR